MTKNLKSISTDFTSLAMEQPRQKVVGRPRQTMVWTSLQLIFVAFFFLSLTACGTSGPDIESVDEKTGKVEPNFVLEHSTPLPGNHKQVVNIVEARKTKSDTEGSEEKEEPKKAFEIDHENWRVKTNHWVALQNKGLAKKEDLNGELTHTMVTAGSQPRKIPGTKYFLRTQRPASLAKEQPKKFEVPTFIIDEEVLTVSPKLNTAGGYSILDNYDQLLGMKPHQYHMVLLTEKPQNFRFMTVLPSIWNLRFNRHLQSFADLIGFDEDQEIDYAGQQITLNINSLFYKLTISEWEDEPELPSNVQQWTSIAYLIWADDFAPDQLSTDQKQAIVDWLNFGGQLIVSSEALDTLNDSFLRDYLPVQPIGKKNSDGNQINELIERWTLETDANGQLVHPTYSKDDKLVLADWKLKEDSREVADCAGLVVEKEVGRGRVTCLAFPLDQTKLRSWSGFDNWLNGCLLRRPGRDFFKIDDFFSDSEEESALTRQCFRWVEQQGEGSSVDANYYSNFRFLSRDWNVADSWDIDGNYVLKTVDDSLQANATERRFGNDNPNYSPGAWDEYSDIAKAARRTLKDQAGITPPNRQWVLKALLIYLAVLVPGNYLVFRLIGKLEWAWFSIPIISVIGGISVVRAASLDIGFSNKQLQINIVEFVPDYNRVHVTGYGSLYSSLTTSFRYTSNNPTTVALPFPTDNLLTEKKEAATAFNFDVGKRVQFGPQRVLSNTMEMYHFEQLAEVQGPIRLEDGNSVKNLSEFSLLDTLVLRQVAATGEVEFAVVGSLTAGGSADLKWNKLSEMSQLYTQMSETSFRDLDYQLHLLLEKMAAAEIAYELVPWEQTAAFFMSSKPEFSEAIVRIAQTHQLAADQSISRDLLATAFMDVELTKELNLGRIGHVVAHYPLGPNEVRLFARSADSVHDFEVSPKASNVDTHNVIVAQLRRPALPVVSHDLNLAYATTTNRNNSDEKSTSEQE